MFNNTLTNLNDASYGIDFNQVNKNESTYDDFPNSRLVCDNWGWSGSGSGR